MCPSVWKTNFQDHEDEEPEQGPDHAFARDVEKYVIERRKIRYLDVAKGRYFNDTQSDVRNRTANFKRPLTP